MIEATSAVRAHTASTRLLFSIAVSPFATTIDHEADAASRRQAMSNTDPAARMRVLDLASTEMIVQQRHRASGAPRRGKPWSVGGRK